MTFAKAPLATLERAPAGQATQTVDQLRGTSRLDRRRKWLEETAPQPRRLAEVLEVNGEHGLSNLIGVVA
jgi:hypothetical protein